MTDIVTEAGHDDLAPEEVEELRRAPELVHLYDAHRIVGLLLRGEAAQRALDDVRAKVEALPTYDLMAVDEEGLSETVPTIELSEVLAALRGADREDVK